MQLRSRLQVAFEPKLTFGLIKQACTPISYRKQTLLGLPNQELPPFRIRLDRYRLRCWAKRPNLLKETGMTGCTCDDAPKFEGLSAEYRRALWLVIGINAGMFVIEMTAGALAQSQALKADALDFLGDSFTYGISLLVIGMSLKTRATAALIKGLSLGAMGLWVFGSTVYHVVVLGIPNAPMMGAIGFLALAANLASVFILLRYKDGDANVRSVWLCSRNDAIGNLAVMFAAAGVLLTSTAWPDLIVAALMAGLFLWSASQIIRQALQEHKAASLSLAGE